MENYDLSNLPLLSYCEDAGKHHPWLTDEGNRRATFSGRSVTVTRSEQDERQQIPSTGGEQISQQGALADFGISLPPSIFDPLLVDEPENQFAALDAHWPSTFEGNRRYSFASELDFFEGFCADSSYDALLTESQSAGNDVLELPVQSGQLEPPVQPKQSQNEPDAKGISIPESANSDTIPDKCSRKRCAPEPRSSIKESIDLCFQKSSPQSDRLPIKRQKPDGAETEFLSLPREIAVRSQSAAMPEKSADSQKNTEQNPEESLEERVEKETEKWVIRLEPGVERRYVCSYPNCGLTYAEFTYLKRHIFKHIGISIYKCTYPECSNKPYFRDGFALRRHVQQRHESDKFYFCKFCNRRFKYLNTCKEHELDWHKSAI